MKEKVIDGVRFSVAPFMAVEALKLKAFLIKKFGPSIGQAIGALQGGLPLGGEGLGGIAELKLDGTALSLAIEKLMGQLDEGDFISLIQRLFQNVTAYMTKEGKLLEILFTKDAFDTSMNIIFSGRLFSVYGVIGLVLEANYPDFFEKVAPGIGRRIQKTSISAGAVKSSESEATS